MRILTGCRWGKAAGDMCSFVKEHARSLVVNSDSLAHGEYPFELTVLAVANILPYCYSLVLVLKLMLILTRCGTLSR
jgi:hypothetical protein